MKKSRILCAVVALIVAVALCTYVGVCWANKEVSCYGIVAECIIYSAGVAAIWACTDDVLKGSEK